MKRIPSLAAGALVLLLSSCAEEPKKVAKEEPAVPIGGQSALYKTYGMARGWAADVTPVRVVSMHLPDVKYEAGKAAAWRATWISPGRASTREYTYSAIESEGNLHKGVFQGNEERGIRGTAVPFPLAAVKVETDKAYETALKKAAEYVKKNPDKKVMFVLELNKKFANPTWRVLWGESVSTSNFSIFVDASTGLYLETMR